MDYIWFGVIGLVVGLVVRYFIESSPLGIVGDVAAGVAGGLLGGILFHYLGVVPEIGRIGGMIFAAIGAFLFLFLPRTMKIGD